MILTVWPIISALSILTHYSPILYRTILIVRSLKIYDWHLIAHFLLRFLAFLHLFCNIYSIFVPMRRRFRRFVLASMGQVMKRSWEEWSSFMLVFNLFVYEFCFVLLIFIEVIIVSFQLFPLCYFIYLFLYKLIIKCFILFTITTPIGIIILWTQSFLCNRIQGLFSSHISQILVILILILIGVVITVAVIVAIVISSPYTISTEFFILIIIDLNIC